MVPLNMAYEKIFGDRVTSKVTIKNISSVVHLHGNMVYYELPKAAVEVVFSATCVVATSLDLLFSV